MSIRAMKMRVWNLWEYKAGDAYLLLTSSDFTHIKKAYNPGEGDRITKHDVWIEFPDNDDPS